MSLPRKHVGVYYKCPVDSNENAKLKATEKAQKIARDLQDFWQYHSNGAWDVECQGFALPSECNPKPPYMCSLSAKKIDTGDFDPNFFHTVDNVSAGLCGQGSFKGAASINYLWSGCGQSTTDHELGHNFGLLHDGTWDLEGNKREYGVTSIMGSVRQVQGLCSPHRVLLGFEDEREILWLESTQQVLVAPCEMSKYVLREDEWQNIRVDRDYSISLRKERGTRYPVYRGKEEWLYIHHIDNRDRGNLKLLIPMLVPGESRVLDNGIEIIYHEFNEETARVTVQYPDQEPPEDLEMPHGPPPTLASSRITEEHSGAWYKPEYDGQGFDIQVKGDRVTLYNYAFTEYGQKQLYYIGNGTIEDGACIMDLYTTEGGTFDNPAAHTPILVGKGQLFFNDDTTGVFHYNMKAHGRGAVNLTLLAKQLSSDLNGSWYLKARNGEGLSINQFSNILLVYWFTYDNNGNQKWYVIEGADPKNMRMWESKGGRWLFYDDVESVPIGTASIEYSESLDSVKLRYDSTTLGKGVRPMTRLF